MKRFGKIAVWIAGVLALNAGLRAADDSSPADNPLPDNPYAAIVARNIFGLNPPPDPNALAAAAAANNLPKITATGIMGVFGHLRALYKVGGSSKPGQKDKEQFYNLSEGQAEDGIEVVKIDDKNKLVTFNNNGTVQELPLVNTPAGTSSPAPATGGGNPATAALQPANSGFSNPGSAFTRFGGRPGGYGNPNSGGPGSAAGANGANLAPSLQSVPTRIYQPEASTMTPEQTVIWIEGQRAKFQQEGNPMAKILPPTPLTGMATGDGQ